jgi:hypothetical protein
MNDRFLPLTRRGLRCFRSGIGLAALCMLTGGIQQYVTLLSPGAGLSLRWLQPVVASMGVVASGLMLVGVLVANHRSEQVLAPGWADRHIKELVGSRPLGGRSAAVGQAATERYFGVGDWVRITAVNCFIGISKGGFE